MFWFLTFPFYQRAKFGHGLLSGDYSKPPKDKDCDCLPVSTVMVFFTVFILLCFCYCFHLLCAFCM